MDENTNQNLYDNSPFIAWIHNISLNQQKYMKSKLDGLDFDHNMRYIIFIFDNPNCSQEDLVNMFGQSKGNIAKVLRKFEDDGYIKRQIDPNNRRKYMLTTTERGNDIVPKIRQISKDWEKEVGISEDDYLLKKRIIEIALNGMKLVE
ncbi:MarR family transcriptional regulator [Methanobrevibacter sp.]|uniref:MarR family winged helix-turn-helix transcriptional regulator n=1 Tax=Methanobrevibacter sp. TaxID=66852 RepID=UPI0025DBA7A2|nr:MarR family transcriptional regulator [Methanobrevibacter sp.]MBQ2666372.1 MarR family transcriptional regulator [Methanobrevibacter sp.]MBQ2666935.1 MarR family transcriptional regulator [Methanobrevibacter sp.]